MLGWSAIGRFWKQEFGKMPDMNAVLFMIGMRELGQVKKRWKKDEKMDLFHVAICRLLSYEGMYTLDHLDQDGWPHYVRNQELPPLDLKDQELLLKSLIIRYFREEGIMETF